MNKNEIQRLRTNYFIIHGWDLKMDFFKLSGTELSALTKLRQMFGFSGKNNLGRSADRQFWYYLQRGFKKFVQQ